MGFMSNLAQSQRLTKNTSHIGRYRGVLGPFQPPLTGKEELVIPGYADRKPIVFVMDNARQHVAKVVQEKLLQYFNILYLSPYTPQFNVKLTLFPLLILPDN